MRKWGLLVTLFYAVILVFLLLPGMWYVVTWGDSSGTNGFSNDMRDAYTAWQTWVILAILIVGQGLLLFLKVDASQKRLRPRAHVLISGTTAGLFLAVLTYAAYLSVKVGFRGDKALPDEPSLAWLFGPPLVLWVLWTVVFYLFSRNSTDPVTRAVSWLFRGSVLELLIAVPAHVIVRRRHDCSAPVVTGFGIASGIAIMLLSFGPSVLLLFKKRMDRYAMTASKAPKSLISTFRC